MKNTNKKGFTIVELVIVIAVIAILAAVLIPTFVGLVNKANVASDTALVKNLNTALAADTDGCKTMAEALAAAAEYGYDVAKINAKGSGNEILWDSVNNVFCYFDSEKNDIAYIPDFPGEKASNAYDYWVISAEAVNANGYSVYYTGDATEVEVSAGFDAGTSAVTTVIYKTDAAQNVVIRTNSGKLVIDATNATVNHYGDAAIVDIAAVASASYHEFGAATLTKIAKGRYVVESTGVTNTLIVVDTANVNVVENGGTVAAKVEDATEEEIKEYEERATMFAGGVGTSENPYLIENAEQMQNITKYYEVGFTYFKVAEGVTSIDCSGWVGVKLNGSFDGNGVEFENVTTALFQYVGYQNENNEIYLKNFTANMNVTDGRALVRSIFNAGTTTFENVTVHGYIEGQYNMGSFYNYGTANYADNGASYTVRFINAKSDATLVCTTGNTIGGMLGHGYEGADYTLTIEMDENSGYTGKMYGTAKTGYAVMAMCSHATYVLNGETASRYENTYAMLTLANVAPVESADGYTVTPVTGAAKLVVSVNPQVTAYDANGEKIQNLSGMTWSFAAAEITEISGDSVKVYDKITSAVIVNGTDNEYSMTFNDGVLTIYSGRSDNYCEGTVRIQVNQYDANGNLLACGTVTAYTIEK